MQLGATIYEEKNAWKYVKFIQLAQSHPDRHPPNQNLMNKDPHECTFLKTSEVSDV